MATATKSRKRNDCCDSSQSTGVENVLHVHADAKNNSCPSGGGSQDFENFVVLGGGTVPANTVWVNDLNINYLAGDEVYLVVDLAVNPPIGYVYNALHKDITYAVADSKSISNVTISLPTCAEPPVLVMDFQQVDLGVGLVDKPDTNEFCMVLNSFCVLAGAGAPGESCIDTEDCVP